ncbi:HlyD family secretion protein [Methylobacterium oryzae]|uniref:HlyD family secretion protein n=1 Tax=Methylobacterium oryzae TaxID=334852 RepID=UPI002F2E5266
MEAVEWQEGHEQEGQEEGSREQQEGHLDRKGYEDQSEKRSWFGRPSSPALLLVALVMACFVGVVLRELYRPRPDIWTDDAYVRVHYASIAPRVSGQVVSVAVDDNQTVRSGDLLVQLDDRDYRAAEMLAEANLAQSKATLENSKAAVEHQLPTIEQARQQLASADAQLTFAEADAARYERLAQTGSGTVQTSERTSSTKRQAEAAVAGDKAALDAAQVQLKVLKSQAAAAKAAVDAGDAQLRQAKLNLSYTQIRAPVDGMVSVRSVQVGNYVSPGTGLMAVVPLAQIYVEANYREVQLRHVRSGQKAKVHVDAYGIDLDGVVVDVPAASTTTFSTIQPDNATGNFTKIVQRLPVRIEIPRNQPNADLLRVGFSVEVTVETGLADVTGQEKRQSKPATRDFDTSKPSAGRLPWEALASEGTTTEQPPGKP